MNAPALPPDRPRSPHRWVRVLVPVAAVGAAVGSFAIAQAATQSGSDSPRDLFERSATTTTSTSLPDDNGGVVGNVSGGDEIRTETFLPAALADGQTRTFVAGAAGTVTINRTGTTLTVVGVGPNPGWTVFTERGSGPSVEVEFRTTGARIDVEAEFEDGGVRVRVRERVAAAANPPATALPRVDNSGPGSIDDRHGDDDQFDDDGIDDRHGGDDDGVDDNSGPGSSGSDNPGPDDSDADDDNSGSGSSGSGSSGSGNSGSGHSGSDD